MKDIKLSVCLPTFNRAPFLNKALTYFTDEYKFPFTYEIVISDNASTDDTQEVVRKFIEKGLPIRYFRRSENIGYEPNLASAFRHAKGEYTVYLADDDVLVIDGLVAALKYMDANQDVGACYAPWYMHNEVERVDMSTFYSISEDVKFPRWGFVGVFQLLVERHIFPEIGVYRASALRSAWIPRYFSYWAFSHLVHYLDQSSVAFLKTPFYRAVIQSVIVRDRPQAGNDEVLTAWDRYRGGLEYFVYFAAKRGAIKLTPEIRTKLEEGIRRFTMVRMGVAMRMWVAKKEYNKAYELYTRLILGGAEHLQDVQRVKDTLPLMVAVHTLAWLTNAAAEVDRLILHEVADIESLGGLVRENGLRSDITIVPDGEGLSTGEKERTAVFVTQNVQRQQFIDAGYSPNLVFSEEDIIRFVVV